VIDMVGRKQEGRRAGASGSQFQLHLGARDGKTSPSIDELDALTRLFGTTTLDLLRESQASRPIGSSSLTRIFPNW